MTRKEFITKLREATGFAQQANKDWVRINCPTCKPGDVRKHKRSANYETGCSRCFLCDIPIPVRDILGLGKDVKFERVERAAVEEPLHPQATDLPCTGYVPINQLELDHPAVEFLLKDHLNDFTSYWENNEIGYIPKEGATDLIFERGKVSTAHSLVFPVRYRQALVGWQLRFLPTTRPNKIKYMHLFKKGNYLYNYDNVRDFEMVVVVEGVKKALKFPNAVATFGKNITEEQIQKLLHWKHIVFMYDNEEETQTKTNELVKHFIAGGRKCININPGDYGYPSPDEMPLSVAQQIVYTEWNKTYGTR